MGNIIICRANQVEKKTAELKPAAVLSIEHPGAQPGDHGSVPRLTGTPQMVLSFWDSEDPETQNGPDIEQVDQGLQFVLEHIEKGDVIIHCNAGVSRSTAMALGVLSVLYPRLSADKLIDKLLGIRPQSGPNILVVEFMDMLTGRNGKLIKAMENHSVLSQHRAGAEIGRSGWLKRNPEVYKKMHPEKFPPKP